MNDSVVSPDRARALRRQEPALFRVVVRHLGQRRRSPPPSSPGTDPELAQVDVQNRLKRWSRACHRRCGRTACAWSRRQRRLLDDRSLLSTDGRYDEVALERLHGAQRGRGAARASKASGACSCSAPSRPCASGSIRQAHRLRRLTMDDMASAIRAAERPDLARARRRRAAVPGQRVTVPLTVKGSCRPSRSSPVSSCGRTPMARSGAPGDVARVELGAQSYAEIDARTACRLSAGIQLAPGANAVRTAELVRTACAELSRHPARGELLDPVRHGPFVQGLHREGDPDPAGGHGAGVPGDVPVPAEHPLHADPGHRRAHRAARHLRGDAASGFSINVLTMFGMVLAIGIIVDDAIVVVENVERIMAEEGLSPRTRRSKAMQEITGAVIGITLVLSAVFIPWRFVRLGRRVIYRQFSLSMAVSILFSAFLALSLTPALCATLLKPGLPDHRQKARLLRLVQPGLRWLTGATRGVSAGATLRTGDARLRRAGGRGLAGRAAAELLSARGGPGLLHDLDPAAHPTPPASAP
jgi:multidrug efflux pump